MTLDYARYLRKDVRAAAGADESALGADRSFCYIYSQRGHQGAWIIDGRYPGRSARVHKCIQRYSTFETKSIQILSRGTVEQCGHDENSRYKMRIPKMPDSLIPPPQQSYARLPLCMANADSLVPRSIGPACLTCFVLALRTFSKGNNSN